LKRPPGWFLVGVGAVAGGFVALEVLRAHEPLALDQGLFACYGRWVPKGWVPYRDLFDSKPPLFLYTWAIGSALPGDPASAMWRFEALWVAATMALAGVVAARLWGRAAGLAVAALLVVGLWSPGWGGYWARAQAEELLALPLFGAALLSLAARQRPSLALWTGVLTGVIGLYKIPAMAVAAAWALGWLAWRGGRDALRMTALLAAGMAVPWLSAIAWFAASGALPDFYEGVFVYQRHFAALIAPPWGAVARAFFVRVGTELPWMVLLALAGLVGGAARRARETVWLGAWIALTATAVVLQRQLAGYHFMLLVPGLALAAAGGLVELVGLVARGRPAMRVVGAATIVGCLALLPPTVRAWLTTYHPVPATGSARALALVGFDRGSFSPRLEEQVAGYLSEHTSTDEGVLVWGLAPGVYALANRHPTTKYPFHKLLMTEAPLSRMIPGLSERRAALIERLRKDPPRYIVVGRRDANGFEPEDSMSSLHRFTALREILERHYRPETEVGRFALYRRTSATLE